MTGKVDKLGLKSGISPNIQGDIRYQLEYVAGQAWRLIQMQDRDPNSPSYGCFHTAYWRDKTSEFPDARFQEAGATLGVLSLPVFDHIRTTVEAPGTDDLLAAFLAGAENLANQQYPEGCYDEWYKGERGFAATAFTTIAYGLALICLGDRVPTDNRKNLLKTLMRSADWLSNREDVVKINHQIAAMVSLAVVWRLTGEARYLEQARHKFNVALDHRHDEGWFNELAGADLGYSHLVIDYLGLYHLLTGDDQVIETAEKLSDFLIAHLHPDLSTAAEAGTCRNAYVGQIGFITLSGRLNNLVPFAQALYSNEPVRARIAAYMADDLRLARWSIMPVFAALLPERRSKSDPKHGLSSHYPQGWTINRDACLAAFHNGDVHLYGSVAGGAVSRIFFNHQMIVEDLGYDILLDQKTFTTRYYDRLRTIEEIENGVGFELSAVECKYFFPSLIQRLVLRFGSVTAPSSRWIRSMIDRYRVKKSTAINQSATSVGVDSERLKFSRRLEVFEDKIIISDHLSDRENGLSDVTVRPNLTILEPECVVTETDFVSAGELIAIKTINLGNLSGRS